MFTTSRNETNGSLGAFQSTNEGARHAFLRHALCFFLLGADLNNCGAIVFYSSFAGEIGTLVRIDVFHVDLWRKSRVLVQQVFGLTIPSALIEVANGRVLVETTNELFCLIGKTVAFVGGAVVG